jgi:hypothetical protein
MIVERVLSYDPLTGVQEIFRYDEVTHRFEIIRVEDHSAVMEDAQERRKQFRGPGGGRWKPLPGDFNLHHVASIPLSVYMDLVQKGIAKDKEALRKWLNDPENQVFRTRPGRV